MEFRDKSRPAKSGIGHGIGREDSLEKYRRARNGNLNLRFRILSTLRDSEMPSMQRCKGKLQIQYAGRLTINIMSFLKNVLNGKMSRSTQMIDRVSSLEA